MATFTRRQLRDPVTDTDDFEGNRDFELANNSNTTAYFNIEGVNNKDIFNTASLTSLVNCSVVTESIHAGFIVSPNVTATFTFNTSTTIEKEDIRFRSSNTLVLPTRVSGAISDGFRGFHDITLSGSVFGVNLDTNA